MRRASRAIIIEDNKILVMFRDKEGRQYYTLVGGQVSDHETAEQALLREVMEETGLTVTHASLAFIENHPAPYNEQYIYRCQVAAHEDIAIQSTSEEGFMNRIGINTHEPVWVAFSAFGRLPFVTPQLQAHIMSALTNGFSNEPVTIS